MRVIGFAAPILPGKKEAWRQFIRTLAGDRLDDYEKSRRRAGISREIAWVQKTPQGEFVLMHIETTNPPKTLERFASSQDPFDVWFRQMVLDIHGFDLTNPPPMPKLGFEWGLKGFISGWE